MWNDGECNCHGVTVPVCQKQDPLLSESYHFAVVVSAQTTVERHSGPFDRSGCSWGR